VADQDLPHAFVNIFVVVYDKNSSVAHKEHDGGGSNPQCKPFCAGIANLFTARKGQGSRGWNPFLPEQNPTRIPFFLKPSLHSAWHRVHTAAADLLFGRLLASGQFTGHLNPA
jgi:hypothetical protein